MATKVEARRARMKTATTEHSDSGFIPLSHAANLAPGKTTSAAVWRWCRKGLLARNGERVYLRHGRVGGRVYTKREWLDEFFEVLANADLEHFQMPRPDAPKPTKLPLSHYEADAALRKAGM